MAKSILTQVASEAGVSERTVQRCLLGANKEVWNSTARRASEIRKIAERLNYRPNGAAKAMSTGRFGAVSLLLSTYNQRSYLPSRLLDGVSDELSRRDLSLLIAKLPDAQLTSEQKLPQLLRQSSSDGLLIDYTDHIPVGMLKLLRRYQMPSIWINSQQPTDCVRPDDHAAGVQAAQHLLRLGHRDIAFVDMAHDDTAPEEHYSARARRLGYEQAMNAAGLNPRVFQQSVLYADRAIAAHQWLMAQTPPTAIIAYSGETGGAVMYAAATLGRLVPRDLSVLVFDDAKFISSGMVVTTLKVPQYEIGREAAAMLLDKIHNPQRVLPPRALPFKLEEGQSVISARQV